MPDGTAQPVRVRFAPSPTGHLHIGGLRTALFNWLFARHYNGSFLMRIEDTDLERSKKEYTDSILESFAWVNIVSDEPIVVQSERINEHKKIIAQLLQEGKAYRCYCTAHEKSETAAQGGYTKYPGTCRNRTTTPDDAGKPYAVRFKLPEDQESVTFDDLIRGPITIGLDQIDDFIIARSDGTPMYNFVVVVDDAAMKITHVIRGEEHIANTPRQLLLYQACKYAVPQFAHLPMILGPDGNKLSKRDAATSVIDYKKNGYLPDALCNYLVRLGWAHGDQEIFTRQEMVDLFSLDHVGKKGAIFDQQKLDWLNGIYMRACENEQLLSLIRELYSDTINQLHDWNETDLLHAVGLYKERTSTLRQLIDVLYDLYKDPTTYNHLDIQKWISKETVIHLKDLTDQLEKLTSFSTETCTAVFKQIAQQYNLKLVMIAQPVRIALIGHSSGPGVFELLTLLGKDVVIRRLNKLIAYIN
jgi:glutamyl-tRNA synthetase